MKKLVNLLFIVTFTCINLNAQESFSCESSGTVVSYVTGGTASSGVSNLALISIADGEITSSNQFTSDAATGVNSIGYNVRDDYIWGYNIPKRKIVRIGADNSINYYDMDHEPDIGGHYYNTADVSPDGVLYMKCDSYNQRLDRVELNGAHRTQRVLSSITLNKSLYTADFAFNPKDGKIYFIDYKDGKFKRIDIVGTTGTIHEVADVPGNPYTVIAAFDVDGNFYYNDRENINKIEFIGHGVNIIPNFSKINNLTQGDGARCANAPVGKSEIKKSKLIADYHLDECLWDGTAGEVKDSSGNGFNGRAIKAVVDSTDGQINGSGKFMHSSDKIEVKNIIGLDSGDFSVSFWTKIDPDNTSTHRTHNLLKLGSKNSYKGVLSVKYSEINNQLRVDGAYHENFKGKEIINGYGQYIITDINDGAWHHIIVSYHNENMNIYVDTVDGDMSHIIRRADGSGVGGESHLGRLDAFNGDLWIGSSDSSLFDTKVNIDEVKLYSGALSSEDIDMIHNNESKHKNMDGTYREEVICSEPSKPFECNENSYLFSRKKDDSTTQSRVINLLTGDITTDKESFGNVGAGINAIGFNPVDGFIYGWSMGDYVKNSNNSYPNGHLIKIDADYHVSNVNLVKPFETNSGYIYLGDVSKDGIYYLTGLDKVGKTLKVTNIKVIDLNTMTQLPDIELKFPVGIDDINNADFAINPIDDNLYVVNYNNSYEHNNQLLKIHLHGDNIGKVEELGRVIDDSHRVHSVFNFFDKYGNFYTKMSDNLAGSFYTKRPDTQSDNSKIYKIDISKPWSGKDDSKAKAKPFTDLTLKTSGDGARCALAGLSKKATLHIEEQQFKVPEGNKNGKDGTNGRDINITISSDIKIDKDITILLGQIDGSSATKNVDYKSRPTTELIFPKGSKLVKYTLRDVIADSKVENDEIFRYLLGVDPDNTSDASFDIDSPVIEINIIDDDFTTFTAFDTDADTHKTAKDKRIKTKIIGKEFKLVLANINTTEDVEDVNRSTTKVKIVEHAECSKKIEQLDIDSYEKFVMDDKYFGKIFNFTVDSAIKDAAVQFIWKDRRGIMRTSCSADRFAIRPKKFSFSYNSLVQARKATAGKPYGLSIYALSEEEQPSNPYNEENGVSFRIDANQSDPSKCSYNSNDFDDSNMTIFSNGILDGTIKYGDIGKLTIKVSEINGSEFAKVDENDTSWADRIITPESVEVEFRPDHFDINVSMDNKHTNSDYAFYSNDVYNSPTWMIQATAKDAGNKVLKNFDNTCQEKMVDLGIFLDINASDDLVLLSNIEEDKDVYSGTTSLKLDSNISSFTDGVGTLDVKFNFQRSSIVPLDPALLNMRKVDLEIVGENVTGTKVTEIPMQYQYMRTYIQDPIAVIGKNSITTEVYYETYESSSRSIFAIKGNSSKSGERNWYKVKDYDNKSSKMTYRVEDFMYSGTSSYNRLTISKDSDTSVTITATHLPEKNVVVLGVNDDFKTNDSGTIETHVTFKPDSVNWAGDGKTGMTVDNNVSTRVYKKMNW